MLTHGTRTVGGGIRCGGLERVALRDLLDSCANTCCGLAGCWGVGGGNLISHISSDSSSGEGSRSDKLRPQAFRRQECGKNSARERTVVLAPPCGNTNAHSNAKAYPKVRAFVTFQLSGCKRRRKTAAALMAPERLQRQRRPPAKQQRGLGSHLPRLSFLPAGTYVRRTPTGEVAGPRVSLRGAGAAMPTRPHAPRASSGSRARRRAAAVGRAPGPAPSPRLAPREPAARTVNARPP